MQINRKKEVKRRASSILPLSGSRVWEIAPYFVFESELGSGTYGSVCQAHCFHTKEKVAIKKFTNIFDDPQLCRRMLREVELLHILDHPYILKAKSILLRPESSNLYLVEDLAASDLRKFSRSSVHLDAQQIKLVLYRLLVALNYLHSGGVVHRDIKPGNVLVGPNCHILLCDFSLSRALKGLRSGAFDCDRALREYIKNAQKGEEAKENNGGDSFTSLAQAFAEKRKVLLKKSKEAMPSFQRELTGHVATRWYRAPELILVEKIYSTAVDMWAAGCIFGELLQLDKANVPDYKQRKPLFTGSSCFPLSPPAAPSLVVAEMPISPRDQLSAIINIKGTPSESEAEFISDAKAAAYVQALDHKRKLAFQKFFPQAPSEAIDLLERLLEFNPYSRITAKEALCHKYFDEVRDPAVEIEMHSPVELLTDSTETADLHALVQAVVSKVVSARK